MTTRALRRRSNLMDRCAADHCRSSARGVSGGRRKRRDRERSRHVEPVEGTDLSRITLTADAAERLDIQTAPVEAAGEGAQQRTVIPYSAVFYESNGETWAYTNPEPLTFVRESHRRRRHRR